MPSPALCKGETSAPAVSHHNKPKGLTPRCVGKSHTRKTSKNHFEQGLKLFTAASKFGIGKFRFFVK